MTCVLDASALLAMLRNEVGGDIVAAALPHSIMCSVNIAEVVERLRRDFEETAVRASVDLVAPPTIAADRDLAIAAGMLRMKTAAAGLSLGDRFCLALAARMGMPVLTADRAWQAVADAIGVDVQLIR